MNVDLRARSFFCPRCGCASTEHSPPVFSFAGSKPQQAHCYRCTTWRCTFSSDDVVAAVLAAEYAAAMKGAP